MPGTEGKTSADFEIAVIGGGIVGLATALALLRRRRFRLIVLEAESGPGQHQSGHNSGVLHSGLYYRPGSLKARNCVEGRRAMVAFCAEHGIAHEICGKLVAAVEPSEVARLDDLERRGRANGLEGLRRLSGQEARRHEPHVGAVAALWVPETGIVDFRDVVRALADRVRELGGKLGTGFRVDRVACATSGPGRFELGSGRERVTADHVVNCAGLQADRVARLCGTVPDLRIVPFRGEYYRLVPGRERLVANLIYPVPDPRFPFLGVHFTRKLGGGVEAGPNAVLAWHREGYRRGRISARDAFDILTYAGTWRLAARHWRTGAGEVYRSLSRRATARALRRLVPDLSPDDLLRAGAGVRAQAVARDGTLVDDFHVLEGPSMLHVLNAPSPAATAALRIGETLADRVLGGLARG